MEGVKTLAVYNLQSKVRSQLQKIVKSKRSLGEDELKKRLAILDTRLCMAPCTLIMNNFQGYKSSEEKWFSEPFYTGPRGYKLCLCVYANGYGNARGSYVTVGVYLMWGENDDILNWPPTGKIRVEVKDNTFFYNRASTYISLNFLTSQVTNGKRSERGYGTPLFLDHNVLHYCTSGNKLALEVTYYIG